MLYAVGAAAALVAALPRGWMDAAISLAFITAMVFVALTDLRTRRIPNLVTVPGVAVALLVAAPSMWTLSEAAAGAGLALVLGIAAYIAGRGALGMGDVKLGAVIGGVLGVSLVPAFLLLASCLGAVGALIALACGARRDATIAFGPYLATAAIVLCLWVGPVATS